MQDDKKMPFTQHLEELRRRLINIAIGLGIGFIVSYYRAEEIVTFLKRPYPKKLIALSPIETFMVYLKVSLFAAVVLAFPLIIHQIWKFVSPGLLPKEKKYTLPLVVLATALFLVGASFCYLLIIPYGIKFLERYGGDIVETTYSVRQYVAFCTTLLFAFGIVFELPLVILFLARIGLVTPEMLARNRQYAVLIIFIIAAILTPTPDVFTQCAMALPVLGLYEISILAARLVVKKQPQPGTSLP